MRTRRRIAIVIGIVAAIAAGVAVAAVVGLGFTRGSFAVLAAATVGWLLYVRVVGPWHRSWGATRRESLAALPGDELVGDGAATTRAITIGARPDEVWPWLVQIGFGRAGWYSYDWIDNDGRPSADAIVGELQHLRVGDRIPMTPDLGFVVVALDPPTSLVALSDDRATSWCLHLGSGPEARTRLVSRFRTHPDESPAALLWTAIADPGAFVMERRMLKGIRRRAEAAQQRSRTDAPAP